MLSEGNDGGKGELSEYELSDYCVSIHYTEGCLFLLCEYKCQLSVERRVLDLGIRGCKRPGFYSH